MASNLALQGWVDITRKRGFRRHGAAKVVLETRIRRFILGLVVVSIIPLFAFAWSFGWLDWLEEAYEEFYTNTIGEPYTQRFRDYPLLFAIPAGIIIALVYWVFPRQYLGRGVVMFLTFVVAFVAGHIFW